MANDVSYKGVPFITCSCEKFLVPISLIITSSSLSLSLHSSPPTNASGDTSNLFIFNITSSLYFSLIFIKKNRDKLFLLSSAFVLGGGIGNLLDRIFLGFVTDYLQLTFFSPVCNISDYFISLGIVMMSVYILKKQ